jgi:tight adherence protein B
LSLEHIPNAVLLAGSGCFLLAVAAAWLLLLDQRSRVLAQRTTAVARPYAPVPTSSVARSLRLKGNVTSAGPGERIGRLIGLEINRPDLYPTRWWVVLIVMIGVGFVLARIALFLIGDIGWVAWPLGWYLGSRWFFIRAMRTYRDTLIRQMPDALAMIVRTVRAGIPVTEAFQVVARESPALTAKEFTILTGELSVGRSMDDALWKMANRTGLREYRFVAVALSLQAQTGGNLTETLEKLADVIRKRAALRQRGKALTSEGRATAVVLTALPFLVAGVLFLITPAYIALLVVDPLGRKFLLAALGCLGTGLLVIRQMIRRSLS